MYMFHSDKPKSERSRLYLVTVHIVLGLLLAATLTLVLGYVVMLLWNALMPDIFSLPRVSYWQGVGMFLLARVLAGGFGHGKSGHAHHGRGDGPKSWKEYDEWWNEVGARSFSQHSQANNSGNTQ